MRNVKYSEIFILNSWAVKPAPSPDPHHTPLPSDGAAEISILPTQLRGHKMEERIK